MKGLKRTLGIGMLALGLGLYGCGSETVRNEPLVENYTELTGRPTATYVAGGEQEHLSIIVMDGDKLILCEDESLFNSTLSNIGALVQHEINDGDEETITLYGKVKGGKFMYDGAKIENYNIQQKK